jgi:hypothetical protein
MNTISQICVESINDNTHIVIEKQECCICMDDIQAKNIACTPCGHIFCLTCLLRAFCDTNACPYCRTELVELPDEDDDYDSSYESSQAEEVDEDGWETVSESEEDDEEEQGEAEQEKVEDEQGEAEEEKVEEKVEEYANPFDPFTLDRQVLYAHQLIMEKGIVLSGIMVDGRIFMDSQMQRENPLFHKPLCRFIELPSNYTAEELK